MVPPLQSVGPKLVDAHVHIRQPDAIASIIAAGITAVRHAGMRDRSGMAAESGCPARGFPVVLSACWALYPRGGYGSLLGVGVDTPDEIRKEIRRLKQAGAGIIKVIASGMVSLIEPGRITAGGFSAEQLSFIAREAKELGLGVMAHANGGPAITAAVEAGVRSIEHGFYMTVPVLEKMAQNEIFWIPTVGALTRAANAGTVSTQMKFAVTDLIRDHLQKIKKAFEIGVPLAVGTDCVLPDPGYEDRYVTELKYFEKAGLSREDVLNIAAEGGARLLGL